MTRIEMLNRALLRIGADPLLSEVDPGADIHIAIYDGVLEHVASLPWSFMRVTRKLVRTTAVPARGFAYSFQLPTDRIAAPRAVYDDPDGSRPLMDYDIEGDLLLADSREVWATLVVGGAARWTGDFREAFTQALMAELALSIREDRTLHDRLIQKAFGTPSENGVGGLIGKALTADNQGLPSRVAGGGYSPLIDVR